MAITNLTSVDIAGLLEAEGLGVVGTDIFVGKEPEGSGLVVTIYDTGGGEQNAKFAKDIVTIQIRCRGEYTLAGNKLAAVKLALEGRDSSTINGTKYVGFWATNDVMFMDYDKQNVAIFTVNFRIVREPASDQIGHRQPLMR